jgi:hypothetical protein
MSGLIRVAGFEESRYPYRPRNQTTWVIFNMEFSTFQILNRIKTTEPQYSLSWKMRLHTSDVRVACVIPSAAFSDLSLGLQLKAYWEIHLMEYPSIERSRKPVF